MHQSLKTIEKCEHKINVSYASEDRSLMYVMICNKLDIVHIIGVISRCMSNPEKDYWEAVK